MSLGLNILLIFVFLLLGSVFAGTELALVSLRGSQIDQMEQEDAREEPFGTAPLKKALIEFSLAGAASLNTAVIGDFEAHRAGLPYLDDIALLTCCYR